jgi:hypothetical protein
MAVATNLSEAEILERVIAPHVAGFSADAAKAFLAFLTAMFLFTIGFATRLTSVLTWVGVLSYIHRMPIFLYGVDSIMNVLVIYLMIGPSGATFSVDRLLEKWWAKKKGKPVPPVRPMVSANFALRLMQIQFCIIYMASGTSKLQGAAWWNGTCSSTRGRRIR